MKSLDQALAEIADNYPSEFVALLRFVFPAECVFEPDHYGDYDFVATEHDPNDPSRNSKRALHCRLGSKVIAFHQEMSAFVRNLMKSAKILEANASKWGIHKDRVCPVSRLVALCGPSAITGFVIAVYVLSFQCHSIWAFSHVGKKLGETSPPFIAHDNSPRAVTVKLGIRGAMASTFGFGPRAVFTCAPWIFATAHGCAVCSVTQFYGFNYPTSTRSASSAPQGVCTDFFLDTTIAQTHPERANFSPHILS